MTVTIGDRDARTVAALLHQRQKELNTRVQRIVDAEGSDDDRIEPLRQKAGTYGRIRAKLSEELEGKL